MFRPSDEWRPNDEVKAEQYYVYSGPRRGLQSVLLYNLTGRDRTLSSQAYTMNGAPEKSAMMATTQYTEDPL